MLYRLRTALITGLVGQPVLQLLAIGAKYAGAPRVLVRVLAVASLSCLVLSIVSSFAVDAQAVLRGRNGPVLLE